MTPKPKLMNLRSDYGTQREQKPWTPLCRACNDQGFSSCPEAVMSDGSTLLSIAWERGVACRCAAGAEFARFQMRAMR